MAGNNNKQNNKVNKLASLLMNKALFDSQKDDLIKKYDLNNDGKIDEEDIKNLALAFNNSDNISEEEKQKADYNKDGKVDTEDYKEFINYASLESFYSRNFGDLNDDGKIDEKDYEILNKHINGKKELDEEKLKLADFNTDGSVDKSDLRILREYIDEMTPKTPHRRRNPLQDFDVDYSALEHCIGLFASESTFSTKITDAKKSLDKLKGYGSALKGLGISTDVSSFPTTITSVSDTVKSVRSKLVNLRAKLMKLDPNYQLYLNINKVQNMSLFGEDLGLNWTQIYEEADKAYEEAKKLIEEVKKNNNVRPVSEKLSEIVNNMHDTIMAQYEQASISYFSQISSTHELFNRNPDLITDSMREMYSAEELAEIERIYKQYGSNGLEDLKYLDAKDLKDGETYSSIATHWVNVYDYRDSLNSIMSDLTETGTFSSDSDEYLRFASLSEKYGNDERYKKDFMSMANTVFFNNTNDTLNSIAIAIPSTMQDGQTPNDANTTQGQRDWYINVMHYLDPNGYDNSDCSYKFSFSKVNGNYDEVKENEDGTKELVEKKGELTHLSITSQNNKIEFDLSEANSFDQGLKYLTDAYLFDSGIINYVSMNNLSFESGLSDKEVSDTSKWFYEVNKNSEPCKKIYDENEYQFLLATMQNYINVSIDIDASEDDKNKLDQMQKFIDARQSIIDDKLKALGDRTEHLSALELPETRYTYATNEELELFSLYDFYKVLSAKENGMTVEVGEYGEITCSLNDLEKYESELAALSADKLNDVPDNQLWSFYGMDSLISSHRKPDLYEAEVKRRNERNNRITELETILAAFSDQKLEATKEWYSRLSEFYDAKYEMVIRIPESERTREDRDLIINREQFNVSYTMFRNGNVINGFYDENNNLKIDSDILAARARVSENIRKTYGILPDDMFNVYLESELAKDKEYQSLLLSKKAIEASINNLDNSNIALNFYSRLLNLRRDDYSENATLRISSTEKKYTLFGFKLVCYDSNGKVIENITPEELALYYVKNPEQQRKDLYTINEGVADDGVTHYEHKTKNNLYIDGYDHSITNLLLEYTSSLSNIESTSYFTKDDIVDSLVYTMNTSPGDFQSELLTTINYNNKLLGQKLAQERLDALEDKNIFLRDLSVDWQGIKDGWQQWKNGIDIFFTGADGIVSARDYAISYYSQGVADADPLGGNSDIFKGMNYEIFTSIGNMLPSIISNVIANLIIPGSGAIMSSISMGLSSAGNAQEKGFQEGLTYEQAWIYGVLNGLSEVGLQRVLGGISGYGLDFGATSELADVFINQFGLNKYFAQMLSEGIEESLQEVLDPVFKSLVTNDISKLDVDWNNVLRAGISGMITSGIMDAGGDAIISSASYAITHDSQALGVLLTKYMNDLNTSELFKGISLIRNSNYSEIVKTLSENETIQQFINENNFNNNSEDLINQIALNTILGIGNGSIESISNQINDLNSKIKALRSADANNADVTALIRQFETEKENLQSQIKEQLSTDAVVQSAVSSLQTLLEMMNKTTETEVKDNSDKTETKELSEFQLKNYVLAPILRSISTIETQIENNNQRIENLKEKLSKETNNGKRNSILKEIKEKQNLVKNQQTRLTEAKANLSQAINGVSDFNLATNLANYITEIGYDVTIKIDDISKLTIEDMAKISNIGNVQFNFDGQLLSYSTVLDTVQQNDYANNQINETINDNSNNEVTINNENVSQISNIQETVSGINEANEVQNSENDSNQEMKLTEDNIIDSPVIEVPRPTPLVEAEEVNKAIETRSDVWAAIKNCKTAEELNKLFASLPEAIVTEFINGSNTRALNLLAKKGLDSKYLPSMMRTNVQETVSGINEANEVQNSENDSNQEMKLTEDNIIDSPVIEVPRPTPLVEAEEVNKAIETRSDVWAAIKNCKTAEELNKLFASLPEAIVTEFINGSNTRALNLLAKKGLDSKYLPSMMRTNVQETVSGINEANEVQNSENDSNQEMKLTEDDIIDSPVIEVPRPTPLVEAEEVNKAIETRSDVWAAIKNCKTAEELNKLFASLPEAIVTEFINGSNTRALNLLAKKGLDSKYLPSMMRTNVQETVSGINEANEVQNSENDSNQEMKLTEDDIIDSPVIEVPRPTPLVEAEEVNKAIETRSDVWAAIKNCKTAEELNKLFASLPEAIVTEFINGSNTRALNLLAKKGLDSKYLPSMMRTNVQETVSGINEANEVQNSENDSNQEMKLTEDDIIDSPVIEVPRPTPLVEAEEVNKAIETRSDVWAAIKNCKTAEELNKLFASLPEAIVTEFINGSNTRALNLLAKKGLDSKYLPSMMRTNVQETVSGINEANEVQNSENDSNQEMKLTEDDIIDSPVIEVPRPTPLVEAEEVNKAIETRSDVWAAIKNCKTAEELNKLFASLPEAIVTEFINGSNTRALNLLAKKGLDSKYLPSMMRTNVQETVSGINEANEVQNSENDSNQEMKLTEDDIIDSPVIEVPRPTPLVEAEEVNKAIETRSDVWAAIKNCKTAEELNKLFASLPEAIVTEFINGSNTRALNLLAKKGLDSKYLPSMMRTNVQETVSGINEANEVQNSENDSNQEMKLTEDDIIDSPVIEVPRPTPLVEAEEVNKAIETRSDVWAAIKNCKTAEELNKLFASLPEAIVTEFINGSNTRALNLLAKKGLDSKYLPSMMNQNNSIETDNDIVQTFELQIQGLEITINDLFLIAKEDIQTVIDNMKSKISILKTQVFDNISKISSEIKINMLRELSNLKSNIINEIKKAKLIIDTNISGLFEKINEVVDILGKDIEFEEVIYDNDSSNEQVINAPSEVQTFNDSIKLSEFFGKNFYLAELLNNMLDPKYEEENKKIRKMQIEILQGNESTIDSFLETLTEEQQAIYKNMHESGIVSNWLNGLSDIEKLDIERYASSYYEVSFDNSDVSLAELLRTKDGPYGIGTFNNLILNMRRSVTGLETISSETETVNIDEAIERMDKTIEKFGVLPDEIKVYRGVSLNSFVRTIGDIDINNLENLIGKTYNDKSYMSTSLKEKSGHSVFSSTDVVLHITVPNDACYGAFIASISNYPQYEFLIKRNTTSIIENAYLDDSGKIIVEMRLMSDSSKTNDQILISKQQNDYANNQINETINDNSNNEGTINNENVSQISNIQETVSEVRPQDIITSIEQLRLVIKSNPNATIDEILANATGKVASQYIKDISMNDYLVDPREIVFKKQLEQNTIDLKTDILNQVDDALDPITKMRLLYIELCKRVTYDTNWFLDTHNEKSKDDHNAPIADYNKKLTFDILETKKTKEVICYGWSQLYKELLIESGFNEEDIFIPITRGHHWVEVDLKNYIGEDFVLIADSTSKRGWDIEKCKKGVETCGFLVIPKPDNFDFRNQKDEKGRYIYNGSRIGNVSFSLEDIDYSKEIVGSIDDFLGYSTDGKNYNELVNQADILFGNITTGVLDNSIINRVLSMKMDGNLGYDIARDYFLTLDRILGINGEIGVYNIKIDDRYDSLSYWYVGDRIMTYCNSRGKQVFTKSEFYEFIIENEGVKETYDY